jgi:hypothetical protein
VNSNRAKPGPEPALERGLLVWEHEWYWVFHGLAHGIRSLNGIEEIWTPIPPPKLSRIVELAEERVAARNDKLRGREGWVKEKVPIRTRGRGRELMIWKRLLAARTASQIRRACRASRFWLNSTRTRRRWVEDLQTHAQEFMTAKSYRYPSSSCTTSEDKRVRPFRSRNGRNFPGN